MTRSLATALALGLALGALRTPAQAGPPGAAAATVNRLHQALTQVAAAAGTLDDHARMERLVPTVRETHAPDVMARERLGAAWNQLSGPERSRLEDVLVRLQAADYTEGMVKPATLRHAVRDESGSGEARVVQADVTGADGVTHRLVYRLVAVAGGWRIASRIEDGRDTLPAERAEAQALWSRGGFAPLLAGLEAKLPDDAETSDPPPGNQTATQVIATLQDTLLDAMRRAGTLGFRGRYQLLEPVVRSTHYLAAIARLTIRRHWDALSPAQQKEFVTTFTELSVSNYASKFDAFKGERFDRLGEQQVGKSTVVRSTITKSNGEKVRFDYTMRQVKGRWRILNITVDGVSDLSTKQAEYGAVMASGGLPALLAKLREQIRKYQAGS